MNIKKLFITYFAGLVIVSLPFVLQSQDLKQPSPKEPRTTKPRIPDINNNVTSRGIKYIPPSLGKKTPASGATGGTRGGADSIPLKLTLLSPGHVAQTIHAQPTFYWYLSQDTQLPTMLTISEINADKPLLEARIPEPILRGYHAIQLENYGIELQENKTYQWSISLIKDTQNLYQSTDDILEIAFLKRISPSLLGIKKQPPINSLERAKVYARNGIWYESLEILMGKNPNVIINQALLESRSELLTQAGLVALK